MLRRFLPMSAILLVVSGCGGGLRIPIPELPEPPARPPPPRRRPRPGWRSAGHVVARIRSRGAREASPASFTSFRAMACKLGGGADHVRRQPVLPRCNFVGSVPFGEKFDDGSTTGVGSLSGNLDERSRISADINFTTSRGAASQSTIALFLRSHFSHETRLVTSELVAGNYLDTERNVVINVNNDGANCFLRTLGVKNASPTGRCRSSIPHSTCIAWNTRSRIARVITRKSSERPPIWPRARLLSTPPNPLRRVTAWASRSPRRVMPSRACSRGASGATAPTPPLPVSDADRP